MMTAVFELKMEAEEDIVSSIGWSRSSWMEWWVCRYVLVQKIKENSKILAISWCATGVCCSGRLQGWPRDVWPHASSSQEVQGGHRQQNNGLKIPRKTWRRGSA